MSDFEYRFSVHSFALLSFLRTSLNPNKQLRSIEKEFTFDVFSIDVVNCKN